MEEDFLGGPVVKNLPANEEHRFDSPVHMIPHVARQLSLRATTTEAHTLEFKCHNY